ncbi:hypothetical protein [Curtobacterium sp. B18]|uniref:hypothetical protein n=1 Tax=Curtobacterium sp. B18 TaxID=95614 RepID=UPI0021C6AF4A|nr:hypothetical protein [Curtobacterium sp. B18]
MVAPRPSGRMAASEMARCAARAQAFRALASRATASAFACATAMNEVAYGTSKSASPCSVQASTSCGGVPVRTTSSPNPSATTPRRTSRAT